MKETEKSQEQIKFEIVCGRLAGKSRGKCHISSIYNICYRWLYAYQFMNYDTCIVGWDERLNKGVISDWGTKFTYYIDEEKGMPIFDFLHDEHRHSADYQRSYLNGLSKYENPYKKYETI